MKWIIAGLGNPGGEYAKTRHNAGRIILEQFRVAKNFPEWKFTRTHNALVSAGDIDVSEILLIEPETFMNESGSSLVTLIKSKKQSAQFIVLYDDIDIAIGTWKLSWNRNSGGHNGVESIATTLKTKEFIRIRIGIAPVNDEHVLQKPKGEDAVIKFVLGKFREHELLLLQKVAQEITSALPVIFSEGLETAMNEYN